MQKHPLNESFTWADHPGPYRRLTMDQARSYDEDGYFVLRGAVDADCLRHAIDEIDPWEDKTTEFLRTQPNETLFIATAGAITFTVHLVLRSAFLREFCSGPVFADLCHDVIGPDARLYWDQAVYKKPEKDRDFPWHQDNGYTYLEPQAYLTCWVALTDADEENGCPWVVGGVNRGGTLRHEMTPLGWRCFAEAPIEPVPLPLKAGDIAVFSSLTPHRTGPNHSDTVRKAYIVQFAPDGAHQVGLDEGGRRFDIPQSDPQRQFPVLVGGNPPTVLRRP